MVYRIIVRVYQTNRNSYFRVVEKAAWGTWIDANGVPVLHIDSGNCGSLRFVSDHEADETFVVTVGYDNNKKWADIVTNVPTSGHAGDILAKQYNNQYCNRFDQRDSPSTTYSVRNDKGRTFTFYYNETEGDDFELDIVIG
jgi:Fungal fruit body lectin